MLTLLVAVIVVLSWGFGFFAGMSSNEVLITKSYQEKKERAISNIDESLFQIVKALLHEPKPNVKHDPLENFSV